MSLYRCLSPFNEPKGNVKNPRQQSPMLRPNVSLTQSKKTPKLTDSSLKMVFKSDFLDLEVVSQQTEKCSEADVSQCFCQIKTN